MVNRDQARTVLLGLGEPTSEQLRADAIGIVIDLLMHPERVVVSDHEQLQDIELTRGIAVEREARLRAERLLTALRETIRDLLDNNGDLLDESRRICLDRAYRWSEIRES